MKANWLRNCLLLVALFHFSLPLLAGPAMAAGDKLDVCSLVSAAELGKLYRKPLLPNSQSRGCYWSLKLNSMAYLHIGVHKHRRPLRKYFNANLSSHIKLVEIKDLGEQGLMSVSEGSLGVVVIKKGDWVLQSAATFLEIKPGSEKHKVLWDIYRRVLSKL